MVWWIHPNTFCCLLPFSLLLVCLNGLDQERNHRDVMSTKRKDVYFNQPGRNNTPTHPQTDTTQRCILGGKTTLGGGGGVVRCGQAAVPTGSTGKQCCLDWWAECKGESSWAEVLQPLDKEKYWQSCFPLKWPAMWIPLQKNGLEKEKNRLNSNRVILTDCRLPSDGRRKTNGAVKHLLTEGGRRGR